jgi:exonuclease III
VNGFNFQIERHRLPGWIKNQDPTICCLQETCLTKTQIKGEMIETDIPSGSCRQTGAAILTSDKANFKQKLE